MAVNLSPIGNGFQFFSSIGLPLSGGKVYTYQAGSSTPLATYTDNTGNVANANPIILGSDGRPQTEIWLTYGYNYKFILKDANDVTIQTYDNLYGIIGVAATSASAFTSGMIMLWSGSIGSIPSGWYLCDGTNGTPNLTDRFIIGAGASYSVGGTGGVSSITLTTSNMPAHTHTATVTDPGHSHTLNISGGSSITGLGGSGASGWQGTNTGVTYVTTSGTNSSTTGVTVTNASNGSGTSFSILNPYYALAYIQKA